MLLWKYMEILEKVSEPLPHALPSLFVSPGKGLPSPGKGSQAHEPNKSRNLFFRWASPSPSPLHPQGRLYSSVIPSPQGCQCGVLQEGKEREKLEAGRQRASLGEMPKFRGLWVRGSQGLWRSVLELFGTCRDWQEKTGMVARGTHGDCVRLPGCKPDPRPQCPHQAWNFWGQFRLPLDGHLSDHPGEPNIRSLHHIFSAYQEAQRHT